MPERNLSRQRTTEAELRWSGLVDDSEHDTI
jgi:hypothetical protein